MKRFIASTLAGLIALNTAAAAQADVGGSVIGPGNCDYPAVGYFGTAVNAVWYICADPVEENCTHWATLYGGWSSQGQGSATGGSGLGIAFSINLGGQGGSSLYLYPDGQPGPAPNPPGAWKVHLVPKPCPAEHRSNKIEIYMTEASYEGQVQHDVLHPPPIEATAMPAPPDVSAAQGDPNYQFQAPANNTSPIIGEGNPEGMPPGR